MCEFGAPCVMFLRHFRGCSKKTTCFGAECNSGLGHPSWQTEIQYIYIYVTITLDSDSDDVMYSDAFT